jgi:hypothetical protein
MPKSRLEGGLKTTLTKPLTNQSQFLISAPSPLRMARLDLRELALPFCRIFLSRFIADGTGGGKFIAPFPWPHCFDDHPRVMALLLGLDDRVKRAAPSAPENIHGSCRVGTRGQCP